MNIQTCYSFNIVLLLHDNSTPHTNVHTTKAITVLLHPTYSPDLTPLDYHLFSPLKEML